MARCAKTKTAQQRLCHCITLELCLSKGGDVQWIRSSSSSLCCVFTVCTVCTLYSMYVHRLHAVQPYVCNVPAAASGHKRRPSMRRPAACAANASLFMASSKAPPPIGGRRPCGNNAGSTAADGGGRSVGGTLSGTLHTLHTFQPAGNCMLAGRGKHSQWAEWLGDRGALHDTIALRSLLFRNPFVCETALVHRAAHGSSTVLNDDGSACMHACTHALRTSTLWIPKAEKGWCR